MSDKLDKLMEEKYKEVLEQQKTEEVTNKQEEDLSEPEKGDSKVEAVYFPYTSKDRESFLVKIEFSIELDKNGNVSKKVSNIVGLSDLDQKVIALRHPIDQENLKYYYNKNNKRGV